MEFNKSIVEEQLRDGQVVETHTITRGEEGHLLMDGKVDGVLSRRDGVVVGDHVDWGGSYGISVRAADRCAVRQSRSWPWMMLRTSSISRSRPAMTSGSSERRSSSPLARRSP